MFPVIVLHIAVEMDVFFPACLAEETTNLLLNGRMDETRAVAELIIKSKNKNMWEFLCVIKQEVISSYSCLFPRMIRK